jgi:cellulose biosynthesis protein BcsQ
MFAWFQSLGSDMKSVLIAIAGSVVGAVVGAGIKWFVDRKLIKVLKSELDDAKHDREHARRDREAAMEGRENALRDREVAVREMSEREIENRERERKLKELERVVQEREIDVEARRSKLDQLLIRLRGTETGIWTTHKEVPPFEDFNLRVARRRPVIITIANHKGGVGKTTLTGNLLAYFDRKLQKRVLAIDLDYQGSLTTMLRSEQAGAVQGRQSFVNALLESGTSPHGLLTATRPLGERLLRSELVPAFYELALLEDRLLVEWLVQEAADDVRYRLAGTLLDDEIRGKDDTEGKYDIVLIDVPPRMTTGTINALCASTHVLIPATFNSLAAEPVENFLQTSKALMDRLNPKLEFLGVVETMSPPSNVGQDTRAEGRRVVREALQQCGPAIHILDSHVPRRNAIADGVAYLKRGADGREARRIFDALGEEVARRTKIL